jgi:superkiller protein 3
MLKRDFARYVTIVSLCVLAGLVAFIYGPTLQGDFLTYRDSEFILKNVSLQTVGPETWGRLWLSEWKQGYAPLTFMSYALNYALAGHAPFTYHLVNVFLHLFVVAGIYFVARRLGLSFVGAVAASALFAFHPLHVSHVAWLSARGDLLCAVFFVWGLFFYIRYTEAHQKYQAASKKAKNAARLSRGYGFLVFSFISYLLSAGSHVLGLGFLPVLFLLDYLTGRAKEAPRVQEKYAFIAIFCVLGLWYVNAQDWAWGQSHWGEGVLSWFWHFVFYLRQFVFPFGVSSFAQAPSPVNLLHPEYLISFVIGGLVLFTLIRFRRYRWHVMALGFYMASSLLLFGIREGASGYADNSLFYLPTMGLCLALGYGLHRITAGTAPQRRTLQGIFYKVIPVAVGCLFVTALIALAVKAYQLSHVWQKDRSLWRYQLSKDPYDPFALCQLAALLQEDQAYKRAVLRIGSRMKAASVGLPVGLMDSGVSSQAVNRVSRAIQLYKRAIDHGPDGLKAYIRLADIYRKIGVYARAVSLYKEVIRQDDRLWDAYHGLAVLFRERGQADEVVELFDRLLSYDRSNLDRYFQVLSFYNQTLQLDPGNRDYLQARERIFEKYVRLANQRDITPEMYINLGLLFHQTGDFERATSAYQNVLESQPDHFKATFYLGNLYRDQGRWDAAIKMYETAMRLDPHASEVYRNIGLVWGLKQKHEKAIDYYEKAIALNEQNGKAYFELAYIYEKDGNLRKAMNAYEKAIQVMPEDARVYFNLANIYTGLGLPQKAEAFYKKAIAVNPVYVDAYVNLSITAFKMGHYKDAVRYCDLAMILGFDAPEAYLETLAPYRLKE